MRFENEKLITFEKLESEREKVRGEMTSLQAEASELQKFEDE